MPALTSTPQTPTQEEQEDVVLACRYGDIDDVRQFVDSFGVKALADARDDNGNCVLHMCCANGHEDILAYILGRPNLPPSLLRCANASGSTALHWACLNAHLGCAKRLVAFRSQPSSKPSPETSAPNTDTDVAKKERIGPALISIRNAAGRTPLGEAEHAGWDDGARWLVSEMDFDAEDEEDSGIQEGDADEDALEMEDGEGVKGVDTKLKKLDLSNEDATPEVDSQLAQ